MAWRVNKKRTRRRQLRELMDNSEKGFLLYPPATLAEFSHISQRYTVDHWQWNPDKFYRFCKLQALFGADVGSTPTYQRVIDAIVAQQRRAASYGQRLGEQPHSSMTQMKWLS